MSDDWFSKKLYPYGDGNVEDGCHTEEAQAMKNYLRHGTTASEAARAITNPIVTAENPREDLVRLWNLLMDALLELPAEHTDSLLELLKAIEDLPEPDFTAVDKDKRPYEDEPLWRGLQGFGHLWCDLHQSGCWREKAVATSGPERDTLRDTHVRKAEIEARFVMDGIGGIPIDWGYEVVADALESSDAVLDFEIPAATKWLVICGQRFRQGAEKGEESWALKPRVTTSSINSSPDLGKPSSDPVMSLGRWLWWEERLRELQGKPGVVQDAATTALDALSKAANAPS